MPPEKKRKFKSLRDLEQVKHRFPVPKEEEELTKGMTGMTGQEFFKVINERLRDRVQGFLEEGNVVVRESTGLMDDEMTRNALSFLKNWGIDIDIEDVIQKGIDEKRLIMGEDYQIFSVGALLTLPWSSFKKDRMLLPQGVGVHDRFDRLSRNRIKEIVDGLHPGLWDRNAEIMEMGLKEMEEVGEGGVVYRRTDVMVDPFDTGL